MADLKISQFADGGAISPTDEIATNRAGVNTKVFAGTAAALDAGAGIGDVVQLEDVGGLPSLPAVDGSQLTGLPAPIPTTITVANEATDTSCFVLFVTAATGDLGPKTNANLTFDSSTGALSSPAFNIPNSSVTPAAAGIASPTSSTMGFYTSGTRRGIITSGNLLWGGTGATPFAGSNSETAAIQSYSTGAASGFGAARASADAVGPAIHLGKNRNAAVTGNTIVQNNDDLGRIVWDGNNGSTYTPAAQISAQVDGTPGASNDMPGRIVFYTTPDGSGTLTEAMRINAAQVVNFVNTPTVGGVPISGGPTIGRAVVRMSANQSIANNTVVNLSFNTENVDTNAFHDNSTNPDRITIPSAFNGRYARIGAAVAFDANATGKRLVEITKNGSATTPRLFRSLTTMAITDWVTIEVKSPPLLLATGDYFAVNVYQNSSSSLDVISSVTSFEIEILP